MVKGSVKHLMKRTPTIRKTRHASVCNKIFKPSGNENGSADGSSDNVNVERNPVKRKEFRDEIVGEMTNIPDSSDDVLEITASEYLNSSSKVRKLDRHVDNCAKVVNPASSVKINDFKIPVSTKGSSKNFADLASPSGDKESSDLEAGTPCKKPRLSSDVNQRVPCKNNPTTGNNQVERLPSQLGYQGDLNRREGLINDCSFPNTSGLSPLKLSQLTGDSSSKLSGDGVDVVKMHKRAVNSGIGPPSQPIQRNVLVGDGKETFEDPATKGRTCSDNSQDGHSLHLKAQIARLCDVLRLPEDVKNMAEKFLKYIIVENFFVNVTSNHNATRPTIVLQALLISTCWNAASFLKYKLDHKESLALAEKHLHFSCKKGDASRMHSFLLCLRTMFLCDTGIVDVPFSPKVSKSAQDLVSDANDHFLSQLGVACNDYQRSLKYIKLEFQKQMKKLEKKHHLEKEDLEKKYNEDTADLKEKQEIDAAVIRSHISRSLRTEKLKQLAVDFEKGFEKLENSMQSDLKKLESNFKAERRKLLEKEGAWLEALKNWAKDELLRTSSHELSSSLKDKSRELMCRTETTVPSRNNLHEDEVSETLGSTKDTNETSDGALNVNRVSFYGVSQSSHSRANQHSKEHPQEITGTSLKKLPEGAQNEQEKEFTEVCNIANSPASSMNQQDGLILNVSDTDFNESRQSENSRKEINIALIVTEPQKSRAYETGNQVSNIDNQEEDGCLKLSSACRHSDEALNLDVVMPNGGSQASGSRVNKQSEQLPLEDTGIAPNELQSSSKCSDEALNVDTGIPGEGLQSSDSRVYQHSVESPWEVAEIAATELQVGPQTEQEQEQEFTDVCNKANSPGSKMNLRDGLILDESRQGDCTKKEMDRDFTIRKSQAGETSDQASKSNIENQERDLCLKLFSACEHGDEVLNADKVISTGGSQSSDFLLNQHNEEFPLEIPGTDKVLEAATTQQEISEVHNMANSPSGTANQQDGATRGSQSSDVTVNQHSEFPPEVPGTNRLLEEANAQEEITDFRDTVNFPSGKANQQDGAVLVGVSTVFDGSRQDNNTRKEMDRELTVRERSQACEISTQISNMNNQEDSRNDVAANVVEGGKANDVPQERVGSVIYQDSQPQAHKDRCHVQPTYAGLQDRIASATGNHISSLETAGVVDNRVPQLQPSVNANYSTSYTAEELLSVGAIMGQTNCERHLSNGGSGPRMQLVDHHTHMGSRDALPCIAPNLPTQIPTSGLQTSASDTSRIHTTLDGNCPAQIAQLLQTPAPSHLDPLQIEWGRIREEANQTTNLHNRERERLLSGCQKEIDEAVASIRRRYGTKLQELDSKFLSKHNEINAKLSKVQMHQFLADTLVYSIGLDDQLSEMVSSSTQWPLQQPYPAASQGPSNFTSMPTTGRPRVAPSVTVPSATPQATTPNRHSVPLSSITPTRPPQVTYVSPTTENLLVDRGIHSPALHLQSRPPAPVVASCSNVPTQQVAGNLTSISPASSMVMQHVPLHSRPNIRPQWTQLAGTLPAHPRLSNSGESLRNAPTPASTNSIRPCSSTPLNASVSNQVRHNFGTTSRTQPMVSPTDIVFLDDDD